MTLHDQIEARTNAANTSAVWKHLKRSERDAKNRQRCISCLRWEEEGVVVAGYCDDWNRKMASNEMA